MIFLWHDTRGYNAIFFCAVFEIKYILEYMKCMYNFFLAPISTISNVIKSISIFWDKIIII